MSVVLFVGRRYLVARRRQAFISLITIISTLGVAVGVMALVVALAISTGFTTRIQEKIQLLNAHLNILTGPQGLDEDEAATVRGALDKDPRVKAYTPIVLGTALVVGPSSRTGMVAKVLGVDMATQSAVVDLQPYIDGTPPSADMVQGEGTAVIGAELARSLGAREGDTIQLLAPRVTLSPFGNLPKLVPLRIVGVLRTGYYLYDTEFVYVALPLAQHLYTGAGAVSAIQVRLKDGRDVTPCLQDLQKTLGPAYRVLDLIGSNAEFFKALRMERVLLFLAIGLIVMVAALNIVSTLILMVMEKVRDIGILRSMGASPSDILRIFLFQGVIIGAVGTALGAIVGVVACRVLDRTHAIPLSLDVYPLPFVPFVTSVGQVVWVCAFALAVSFLATLYPAYRAARLDPVEALRYE